MDVSTSSKTFKKIKSVFLIFFCVALIQSCGLGERVAIEQIDYEDEKAVGVKFRTKMDIEKLRVYIGNESQTSVIGVIVSEKDTHIFTPVVPFTPGQTYSLRKLDTVVLASFTVPTRDIAPPNKLLAIYPQLDTVPENLLKMYLEFSRPMQEVGNALDYIRVTNETDGEETQPFLRLESELWNKEHTVLTLWLDPGRIKTDLIPNKELGLPLRAGNSYTVTIDRNWKSRQSAPLAQDYVKKFYVGPRDNEKPELRRWRLEASQKDTLEGLNIDFGEPMDAFLALETIQVYGKDGKRISGRFERQASESQLRFVPDGSWADSEIELRVQSRLEDLAGNNLERQFDTPMKSGNYQNTDTIKIRTLQFRLAE